MEDDPGCGDVLALEDGGADDSDSFEFADDLADIMDEVSPAATPGTTPRGTPGTTPRGSPAPSTSGGATLPGTPPAEPSVAGSPPGTPPAEAPPSGADTELLPEMWGHFRIQAKRPCLDAPYGGYVAICRYHALHANYGCQLSRSMQDNTDEQREAVLNMMRHWCNMAPRYDRQHKHVYSRIQLASTPSPAVVRAQVLIDPPPAIVKTDAEFKAEAAGYWLLQYQCQKDAAEAGAAEPEEEHEAVPVAVDEAVVVVHRAIVTILMTCFYRMRASILTRAN